MLLRRVHVREVAVGADSVFCGSLFRAGCAHGNVDVLSFARARRRKERDSLCIVLALIWRKMQREG
jgi:hypothetical protein